MHFNFIKKNHYGILFSFISLLPLLFLPMIDMLLINMGCWVFLSIIPLSFFIWKHPVNIMLIKKDIHIDAFIKKDRSLLIRLLKGKMFVVIKGIVLCFFVSFSLIALSYMIYQTNMLYYGVIAFDVFVFNILNQKIKEPFKMAFEERAAKYYGERALTVANTLFLLFCWLLLEIFSNTPVIDPNAGVLVNANAVLETVNMNIHHSCLYFMRYLRFVYIGNLLIGSVQIFNSYLHIVILALTTSCFSFLGITYLMKASLSFLEERNG